VLILYLSGREVEYTRNDVLVRALKRIATVDVLSEHGPGSILFRSLRLTLRALPLLFRKDYDLVVVGFYGHLLMLPIGLLSRAPILFDAFVSTYDTLVQDRRQVREGSLGAYLARWLDRTASNLSDQILLDTPQHAAYFESALGITGEKLRTLPVGCNEELFAPRPVVPHEGLVVLYYCTYLPLHGADVVLAAAAMLEDQAGLSFRLVGRGPEYDHVRALAEKLELSNLAFVPALPLEGLVEEISRADICLGGHFGQSEKASRVIPGKIYQILSMAKPLIAADTPANLSLLEHERQAFLCPPGDPAALAAGIADLASDPARRGRLAQAGRRRFLDCCSEAAITKELSIIVGELVR
jgi:glycosyltransferase involved in cell wall biosynthesis